MCVCVCFGVLVWDGVGWTWQDAFEFEGSPVEDKRSKKPQSKGKPKQALENQDVQEEDKENSPAAIKTQAKTGRCVLVGEHLWGCWRVWLPLTTLLLNYYVC